MPSLTIGTRGSALALVQTEWVATHLRAAHPDLELIVTTIQTQGDKSQALNTPLSSYSEKGVFAKELEQALLTGEIDVAVHSMKDLAAHLPHGLHIAAVPTREDPRDALVGRSLDDLPPGARIGTGSVRRAAVLRFLRPDLTVTDIRGNVDTRIRKLRDGQYDTIVLAVAGLNRLGRAKEIAEVLNPELFVPDAGQGALAIQARSEDARVNALVSILDDAAAHRAVHAERAFLRAVGGGCQTPVGAHAWLISDTLFLRAMLADPNGAFVRYTLVEGSPTEAEQLGHEAAGKLEQDEPLPCLPMREEPEHSGTNS